MDAARLRERVADVSWYQTINLPGGVLTPGVIDTRRAARTVGLPADLGGKRCLDIGTCNGFWAFEMERRGAADVTAIDVGRNWEKADWPAGAMEEWRRQGVRPSTDGFEIAHEALGSGVVYRSISVYELSPESVGEFDFVFLGSLLLHLRDPVRALEAVRSVTRGTFFVNDSISLPLTMLHPREPAARLIGRGGANWWVPNVAGLKRMLEAAGFQVSAVGRPYALRWGSGAPAGLWKRTGQNESVTGLARKIGRRFVGNIHIWMTAVPRR
jgi:tRNA (mo5U34)-methyltransferase